MLERTESKNTERLVKYLDSLGAEQSEPRTMEYVWALIAIVLLALHLETNISTPPVQAKPVTHCERYADVLSKILTTGGKITAPGAVATCKVKHVKEGA